MKLFILALFLLAVANVAAAQSAPAAPAAAMPNSGNAVLIDSLMTVSRYKEYFVTFCDRQIDKAAKAKNWNFDQTRERKLKVNFDAFKKYTIYNWFSGLTRQELLELIAIVTKLNSKNPYSSFLFTHEGVQSNLELFVEGYLK